MIRSNLCDYIDAYIHAKGTITVPITVNVNVNVADASVQVPPANNRNKEVIFKNCVPFTSCINNTQEVDAHDII